MDQYGLISQTIWILDKFVSRHSERKKCAHTEYSFLFFKETKALLEQEENLLDKVDDVDSDLERTYEKEVGLRSNVALFMRRT